MVQGGLLTPRFVACLSMTDFPNPVFSGRRAALLGYVPEELSGTNPGEGLEAPSSMHSGRWCPRAVTPLTRSTVPSASFWPTGTRQITRPPSSSASRLLPRLEAGMTDPDVVDGWFRLAEYRRRRFRRWPLAEFSLTTPRTNISGCPHCE